MDKIYFRLRKVKEEPNELLDHSKLLGKPVCPRDYFEDVLDEDDYFVAQINLEELKDFDTPLPKTGFIYFFVNVETYECKMFYTSKEPEEVIDDINDGFDEVSYGCVDALYIEFDKDLEEGNYILGEIGEDDLDFESLVSPKDNIIFMCLDSLEMPQEEKALLFASIAPYDGYYIFTMKKEDLENHKFNKLLFFDWGS